MRADPTVGPSDPANDRGAHHRAFPLAPFANAP